MRVFVTGASGWIGSAVVPELIGAGHEVTGLARSDASAAALTAVGARVQRGTIDDLDILRTAAAASDGVIHLAFKHDIAFSGGFEAAAEANRRAVETFGEALAGTDRPFVIASGTLMVAPGRMATERDGRDSGSMTYVSGGPRMRAETDLLMLSLASRGVRSSVLRLPPTVHGDGDHGFMATIVGIARDTGVSGYLAVEQAPAGSVLHAVADEGVPIRDVAEVIGRHLNLPVASVPEEQAGEHFRWLASFIGADAPASSALTRELLGWQPVQPGLLDDLGKGHYFNHASTRS
jgi:nucleoside-diphosphate-sugar epimerase